MSKAMFFNPAKDSQADLFAKFINDQCEKDFPGMLTAKGKRFVSKCIIDPRTKKPWVYYKYPPPRIVKEVPMVDLRFVPDHNMTTYLGDPPEKHSEFKSLIEGLILSPVNYAIMENPSIVADFIRGFWSKVEEHTDAHGAISIVEKIHGQPIIITEQILRKCLQFGDKESDPVELDQELINRAMYQMGHEGAYPPTKKKLLHPYWRYLAHVFTQCLSGRKGGYDVLNQIFSSFLVALALGVDFNFSKMIFLDMHVNIKGRRNKQCLAFPRFL
ncbi:hypothetical protein R6Q57_022745 [Mikania cordata]